jgi:hypothetical protein
MEHGSIFTGEHALIAYLCMVISYGLRTAPKPTSVWGLWIMSLLQFAFMNLTEGNSNMKTAQTGQAVERSISTVTPATSVTPKIVETATVKSVEPAPSIDSPKGDK